MNKTEIMQRVNGLNEYMLSDSPKELLLLKNSNDYTYNKGIALIEKNTKDKSWYAVDRKNCYKTWAEIEAFIDGLCLGKNTDFAEQNVR